MGLCIGVCVGCGGMVRIRTPQRKTEQGLYHDHCYHREKEKQKEVDGDDPEPEKEVSPS